MVNRENRDSNLAARILLTLHLAEVVFRELQAMPEVVHQDGIYCLKGSESLLPETKRRLLCNGAAGARYETEAHLFASEYASLCPFVKCIAIAGSMASGGFSEEDDIDFNIFVEQKYKYTVYLLGIILSLKYAFKHRRKPLGRKSRTPILPKLICINVIWEDAEALPYVRQDAYFPQINDQDSSEVRAKRTFNARVLRLIYSNPVVSRLGERMCREISSFLWRLVQFCAGITLKHSRVSGG